MNKNSTSEFSLPLLLSIVLIAGMFLGYKLSSSFHHPFKTSSSKTYLDEFVQLIDQHYVDSINTDELYHDGIEGIIQHLDPHTVYISKKDLPRINEQLEGNYSGIGIEFFTQNDTIIVSHVSEDGPSINKGIIAGDRIIQINKQLIAGKKLKEEEIIQSIRGPENSNIQLKVLHLDQSMQTLSITRKRLTTSSIIASYLIAPKTGYIAIKVFSENTYQEFHEQLNKLVEAGIQKLIIDVRDNPGGYMQAVTNIADELIAGKQLLLSTKGKREQEKVYAKEKGLFEQGELIILVNENSASASEILAGTIQDLDRGTIIGRRTYGKGLVQEQFELPDQSAIRITTARYYLPSGRCIQKSYQEGKQDYQEELNNRYLHGVLSSVDSDQKIHQNKFFTTKKHVVYEGEGIRPDIFVALDTSLFPVLEKVYQQNLIENICHSYYFYHRQEFKSFKSAYEFHEKYTFSEELKRTIHNKMNALLGKVYLLNQPKIDLKINTLIKANLSRNLFGNNGKWLEINQQDPIILKALERH